MERKAPLMGVHITQENPGKALGVLKCEWDDGPEASWERALWLIRIMEMRLDLWHLEKTIEP